MRTDPRIDRSSHSTHKRRCRARAGFTLIELLVVIAIIGTLIALLLPAINMVKESARKANCASNMHQIGISLNTYLTAKGTFPPGQKIPCTQCATFSWIALLLPFFEEGTLYDKIIFTKDPRSRDNLPIVSKVIPLLLCPSTSHRQQYRTTDNQIGDLNANGGWDEFVGEQMGCTDYAGIEGPAKTHINAVTKKAYGANQGVMLLNVAPGRESMRVGPRQITDGMSYTLIAAEQTGQGAAGSGSSWTVPGAWASGDGLFATKIGINPPPQTAWDNAEIFSDHPRGANCLFCDGAVRFLKDDINLDVLCALASRSGGEQIVSDNLE